MCKTSLSQALNGLVYSSAEEISRAPGPLRYTQLTLKMLKELFGSLAAQWLWSTDQQRCAQRELGFPGVPHWRCCVLNRHLSVSVHRTSLVFLAEHGKNLSEESRNYNKRK